MVLDFSIYTPTYISFTWALILILSSRKNKAKYVLGLFMLAVFMVFISFVVYFNHLKSVLLPFDLLFVFGSLSIFPFYYLYIKLLTVKSKIDYSDLKCFIPAGVLLLAVAFVYVLMPPEMRKLYVHNYLYGIGKIKNAPLLIQIQIGLQYLLQVLYFSQMIFSYFKIKKYLSEYNEQVRNFYSYIDNKTLEWAKIILYTFAASSVFTIITSFLGRSFFDKSPALLMITCTSYGVFLFILGYLGFLQNHSVANFEADTTIESGCEPISEPISEPICESTSEPIYEPILEPTIDSISESACKPPCEPEKSTQQMLKNQLQNLFEKDQIYKNPELKISDIACKLNTNRTYISSYINSEYECSFSTYVNRHRVNAAKELLIDENNRNFSLEHIATLAGFGSLHSFIRAFKEIAETTPGKYRDSKMRIGNDNNVTF